MIENFYPNIQYNVIIINKLFYIGLKFLIKIYFLILKEIQWILVNKIIDIIYFCI